MKYLVKFFVVTFLIIICTYASAEERLAYMDLKFVLNNSKAGKEAQDFLQNSLKENQKKFLKEEEDLKKQEKDLLAQRESMTQEEYQKKTNELRKKVSDYQSNRRTSLNKITEQRTDARKRLIEKLNPILNTYIKENSISLVLNKDFILGASGVELDITNPIVERLNKSLPSLNLK